MGNLANSANLSRNLYDAAYAVVGHYKGGLAMSTVGACAGFGMICGSSIATAATMSQMAGPEMKRHGYSDALISGSIASGGTLGIIIPPSVILVIYAYLTEQSVQELFFAALIPGLIAVILYMIAIRVYLIVYPSQGGYGKKMPLKRKNFSNFKGIPNFFNLRNYNGWSLFRFLYSNGKCCCWSNLGFDIYFCSRATDFKFIKRGIVDNN